MKKKTKWYQLPKKKKRMSKEERKFKAVREGRALPDRLKLRWNW